MFSCFQTTFDTVFVATGLEPFSIFEVQIRTSNQYTQRLNAGDMIGGQKGRFNTTTGGQWGAEMNYVQ